MGLMGFMKRFLYIGVLSGFVFVLSPLLVARPNTSGPTPQLDPKTTQALDGALKKAMKHYHVPGAVVGVWIPKRGSWIRTTGFSNIETQQRMRRHLRFRIGSITKTFTTTLILQLADEGKLSLDDPIERYVPGIPNGDAISIRMLCNNTSGLVEYNEVDALRQDLAKHPGKVWSRQTLINHGLSKPPYFDPGKGFHYSNTNFILQGLIIEKVTGKTLRHEIHHRIAKPLGLKNTYLPKGIKMKGRYAQGYGGQGYEGSGRPVAFDGITLGNMTQYYHPSVTWAAGAMISTFDDLKIWAHALGTGTLLKEETQKERLTWVDMPQNNIDKYGLGIWKLGEFIGHDGMFSGYNCDVFYYPPEDATIVVMFNLANSPQAALGAAVLIGEILFPEAFAWLNEIPTQKNAP